MLIIQNGTATPKDLQPLKEWYLSMDSSAAQEELSRLKGILKTLFPEYHRSYHNRPDILNAILTEMENVLELNSWASHPYEETKEYKWPRHQQRVVQKYESFFAYAQNFNQQIRVKYWTDDFAFLYYGNENQGVIILTPDKYLEYVPEKDFSEMTPAEVKALYQVSGEQQLISAADAATLTPARAKETLAQQNHDIDGLNDLIEQTKQYKTPELAELQSQIDKLKQELYQKKESLLKQLNEKLEKMEEIKEKMEGQIFLLESQIYAIRCFAGEVVQFVHLRSGQKAPDTEPIVIHQKLRFLDEDLARLTSIYSIAWERINYFEEFLKYSPLALETFAPNKRCVVLVRLSRNNTKLERNDDVTWANLLRSVEYYHGATVGIIIRNGDNLYLGWTDQKKIKIQDDLILGQFTTEEKPYEEPKFTFESDRKDYIKKQRRIRKTILTGIVSRSFIYNILQGIVEHSSILPLPEGVTLAKQSDYVKYAVADAWLSDNRFGSFNDILQRVNVQIQKGDKVLTTQFLRPEYDRFWGSGSYYGTRPYENPRGRGEKNRTHDCSVDDCKIYSINLVEYDKPVSMTRFRRFINHTSVSNPDAKSSWIEYKMKTEDYQDQHKRGIGDPSDEVLEVYDDIKSHIFVSVPKNVWWKDTNSRANFELYEEEYINLTFMNSVWLEWVVTNKSLGGWSIGGKEVDYAYAIRYLKTALDHIRSRESEEKALIDAINPEICKDPEWPLLLSEWKLEKNVHTITAYQAKRFVKSRENKH